jgi:hypothetical protein
MRMGRNQMTSPGKTEGGTIWGGKKMDNVVTKFPKTIWFSRWKISLGKHPSNSLLLPFPGRSPSAKKQWVCDFSSSSEGWKLLEDTSLVLPSRALELILNQRKTGRERFCVLNLLFWKEGNVLSSSKTEEADTCPIWFSYFCNIIHHKGTSLLHIKIFQSLGQKAEKLVY